MVVNNRRELLQRECPRTASLRCVFICYLRIGRELIMTRTGTELLSRKRKRPEQ